MAGLAVWMTGLPCCGKTTIAKHLKPELERLGYKVEHLDGDVVRDSLCSDLGFSAEDRRKNLERITFVSKLLTRNDVIVLCTFVSPYKEVRQWIKEQVEETAGVGTFMEVFCMCNIDTCIKRDVKGMYAKAIKGEIKNFTGISDPYEAPEKADLVVDTDGQEESESVSAVLDAIQGRVYK